MAMAHSVPSNGSFNNMPAFVELPSILLLPRHAELVFNLGVRPPCDDAIHGETMGYLRARTVGASFEAHPKPYLLTCQVLAHELRTSRCQLNCPLPGRGRNRFVGLAEPAFGHPVHARFVPSTEMH